MANEDQFTATVSNWVKETPQRLRGVFRESTQRVASNAANGVPIDTGFARASVRASLDAMPFADKDKPKDVQAVPFDFSDVVLTIAKAELEDTIFIGWTANYAIFLEYGHSAQAPSGFVRIAAEQWPQIVSEVSAELKQRSSASL